MPDSYFVIAPDGQLHSACSEQVALEKATQWARDLPPTESLAILKLVNAVQGGEECEVCGEFYDPADIRNPDGVFVCPECRKGGAGYACSDPKCHWQGRERDFCPVCGCRTGPL